MLFLKRRIKIYPLKFSENKGFMKGFYEFNYLFLLAKNLFTDKSIINNTSDSF
jgi:hypothetical protein